jgi:hypothetical protein
MTFRTKKRSTIQRSVRCEREEWPSGVKMRRICRIMATLSGMIAMAYIPTVKWKNCTMVSGKDTRWMGRSESTFAFSIAFPILRSHWCTPMGRPSSLKAMTWNPMKKTQATSSQSDVYVST